MFAPESPMTTEERKTGTTKTISTPREGRAKGSVEEELPRPTCPVCGGRLLEIHGKLCCSRCHSIVQTCCD